MTLITPVVKLEDEGILDLVHHPGQMLSRSRQAQAGGPLVDPNQHSLVNLAVEAAAQRGISLTLNQINGNSITMGNTTTNTNIQADNSHPSWAQDLQGSIDQLSQQGRRNHVAQTQQSRRHHMENQQDHARSRQRIDALTPAPSSSATPFKYGSGTRNHKDVPNSPVDQPNFGSSQFLKVYFHSQLVPQLERESGMTIDKLLPACRDIMRDSTEDEGMSKLKNIIPEHLFATYQLAQDLEQFPTLLDMDTIEISMSDLLKSGAFSPSINRANHYVRIVHMEEDKFSMIWLESNELNDNFDFDVESPINVAYSLGLPYSVPGIELTSLDEDGGENEVHVLVAGSNIDDVRDTLNPTLLHLSNQGLKLIAADFPGPNHGEDELEPCYLKSSTIKKLTSIECLLAIKFDNVLLDTSQIKAFRSFSGKLTLQSCRFNPEHLLGNRSCPLKELKITDRLPRGLLACLTMAIGRGMVKRLHLQPPSPGSFPLKDLGDIVELACLAGIAAEKGPIGWHRNLDDAHFILGRYSMAHGPGKSVELGLVQWSHTNIQKAVEAQLKDGRVLQQSLINQVSY